METLLGQEEPVDVIHRLPEATFAVKVDEESLRKAELSRVEMGQVVELAPVFPLPVPDLRRPNPDRIASHKCRT